MADMPVSPLVFFEDGLRRLAEQSKQKRAEIGANREKAFALDAVLNARNAEVDAVEENGDVVVSESEEDNGERPNNLKRSSFAYPDNTKRPRISSPNRATTPARATTPSRRSDPLIPVLVSPLPTEVPITKRVAELSTSSRANTPTKRKKLKCFMCEQHINAGEQYLKCKNCPCTVCTKDCKDVLEGDPQHDGCKTDKHEQEMDDFVLKTAV